MITEKDLRCALELASEEFKQLTYEQLEQLLADRNDNPNIGDRACEVAGTPVFIATTFAKFGRLRKRISVEMTAGWANVDLNHVPFVYFERFESGELREPKVGKIGMIVFLYVFPAIALASLLWLMIRLLRYVLH
ncbi:MAG: hypothetical protein HY287_03215 [Planctomycetes bacterium]|nr:hypothetical protein [Planctomycetota bacterium]MBI3833321.1 hypothetical protein [Planctomycetota bacterium]